MTVNQISVFVENKAGQLAELTTVLQENGIDMRALSVADSSDFGIVRMIVNDTYAAIRIVKEAGYVCSATPVVALAIPDEPGSLQRILTILRDGEINLEYMYAFTTRKKDLAYMILRVEEMEKATQVLTRSGIKLIDQDELNSL